VNLPARRCLPGPLTVREAYAIASEEVKACAREGDDPGDVRSNLMPVDHADRGGVEACLAQWVVADTAGYEWFVPIPHTQAALDAAIEQRTSARGSE
jgi:hypothetical protein